MKNTASTALYDLLVTKDFEPEMLDASGRPVTDPDEAEMFSFDFRVNDENYGTVVTLFGNNNELEVFYGDQLGRGLDGSVRDAWYKLLHQIKEFAVRNMLTFELNDISRLKYTMQGIAAIKEGLFEGYYGKRNVSYNRRPTETRLMIKHTRDLAEGEPRHQAIESIYVETADGERFRVPSRSLAHARMLERHVREGGNPYDAFGQHINNVVGDMSTLGRFIRATKNRQFADETLDIVETAIKHYSDLKQKAKRMIGQRGYHEEREQFDPAIIPERSNTVDHIREKFVEREIDNRIEEALPILVQLIPQSKENGMKEIDDFESWVNGCQDASEQAHEKTVPEALDSDGVMMTRPSNMSSESLDLAHIKKLIRL